MVLNGDKILKDLLPVSSRVFCKGGIVFRKSGKNKTATEKLR